MFASTLETPATPRAVVISNVQEFVDRGVDVLPSLFSAHAHLNGIMLVDDGDLPRNVAAAYTAEQSGVVFWQRQSAHMAQAFIEERYRCGHPEHELAFLAQFKSELLVLFHEAVHSLGQEDWGDFIRDFMRDVRDPGATAAKEGLTELAADRFLDRWIAAMGLGEVDPRILRVRAVDSGAYPGQAAAMEELVADVAANEHQSVDDIVRQVVRDGCGTRAYHRLLQSAMRARGVEETPQTMNTAERLLRNTLYTCRQEFDKVLAKRIDTQEELAEWLGELRERGHQHGRSLLAQLPQLGRMLGAQDPWRGVNVPQQRRAMLTDLTAGPGCGTRLRLVRGLD